MAYEQIEERMMAEWLRLHPEDPPWNTSRHVRLSGPLLPGDRTDPFLRAFSSTWPEADMVRIHPGEFVEVVEFIVHRPQETVGQLLYYMWMLPGSVGYEKVKPSAVRGRIVSGLGSPRFREFVEFLGLEYEEYQPPWLLAAIAKRRGGVSPA